MSPARAAAPAAIALLLLVLGAGCPQRGEEAVAIEVRGPAPDHPVDETLRIATANLWGVVVGGFDWSAHIDQRFLAFAERLARNPHDLDVVLIQEAWKNLSRRALLAHSGLARQFPFAVDAVQRPGGSGLVILSRLPIETAYFYRFKAQGSCLKFWEGDCLGGKGLLAIKVRLAGHAVWIGNTHLIACYPGADRGPTACDDKDPNGGDRWSQLVELRSIMQRLAGDDPAILGGDFNFTRTARHYNAMLSPAIPADPATDTPALPPADPRRPWIEPGDPLATPERIDFIWSRAGTDWAWRATGGLREILSTPVRLSGGATVPLSDHPVLMSTLCLVRNDDPAQRCQPLD